MFMQSIFKRLLPILLKTDFSPFYSVYITFDFEHVNAKWSIAIKRTGIATEKLEGWNSPQLKSYDASSVTIAEWKNLRGKSLYTIIKKKKIL